MNRRRGQGEEGSPQEGQVELSSVISYYYTIFGQFSGQVTEIIARCKKLVIAAIPYANDCDRIKYGREPGGFHIDVGAIVGERVKQSPGLPKGRKARKELH